MNLLKSTPNTEMVSSSINFKIAERLQAVFGTSLAAASFSKLTVNYVELKKFCHSQTDWYKSYKN
jgi:hypothetical protein